jgi:hypothetical protein
MYHLHIISHDWHQKGATAFFVPPNASIENEAVTKLQRCKHTNPFSTPWRRDLYRFNLSGRVLADQGSCFDRLFGEPMMTMDAITGNGRWEV